MSKLSTASLREKEAYLYGLQERSIKKLGHQLHLWTGPSRILFQYERSLAYTLLQGKPKFDRTGTATLGVHGFQSRFNLDDGFPLVTTKKVHLKSVIHELLWLVRGDTNIKYLVENGVSIWSDWPLKYYNEKHHEKTSLRSFHELILGYDSFAKEWGELGPIYGKQWRRWSAHKVVPINHIGVGQDTSIIPEHDEFYTIDQLQQVINSINRQHENGIISRRMLVTAWNPGELEAMTKAALPPCHCLFQFHSRLMTLQERQRCWAKAHQKDFSFAQNMNDNQLDELGAPIYELDLQLYQRSCDIFLGVPFNISSYAMLLLMVAQVTNTKPGTFIHDYGDLHIYSNHFEQVIEQLSREPRPYPTMTLKNRGQKIDEFLYDDFVLSDYNPHPAISADVAV